MLSRCKCHAALCATAVTNAEAAAAKFNAKVTL